jgi:fucose permease
LFVSASPGEALVFLAIGMTLTGLTYGPIGTLLAQMFPAAVRYTGSSLCFNLSGILGASVAPYIATWLATRHGLQSVGYYLSAAALLTLFALLTVKPEHD